ncbi:LytR/AlgR family response regulator transcription factor [Echinicola vietnamensis]|uniref:Response regulator of the LytR/AlgR family n=1 Tax=Echinicola vietnamensis (strain DSM 17526 / LMG 23754 / KMM 6221) TaxID=926556 RepID=L0FUI2_ECHVK|nr:LytTR family DNA-binding domain-containing protein [Echinicola vietnamensis]AGA76962.1 response regulator of the LytR/AlgR family [Echinicola vietnamensis DSM 17526]
MKVGIIDDEVHCVESLVLELMQFKEEVEIVFSTSKVEEALEALSTSSIDLMFLDVEMPRINGFELLDMIDEVYFEVVFTTAYSQYALKAFQYKAFDYLLKPIGHHELAEVLKKYKGYHQHLKKEREVDLMEFISSLKKDNIIKSKIAVPVSEGLEFIKVDEIIYAQSQNNYTILHLHDNTTLLFSKTLKEVERTLKKYFFIRIHQSYLINPNYMKKYFRHDGGGVQMENGKSLPISQRKKEEIITLFEAIAKNKSL